MLSAAPSATVATRPAETQTQQPARQVSFTAPRIAEAHICAAILIAFCVGGMVDCLRYFGVRMELEWEGRDGELTPEKDVARDKSSANS